MDKLSQFIEMFGDPIHNDKSFPMKTWNEVLNIKNGQNQREVAHDMGEYPIYGSGGIMGRANDFLCPENTVVVGRKGTINKPLLVKEKFWNVDTAFGIIPNSEILHYQYLFHFCRQFDFNRLNRAAVLPSLTKGDLMKIQMKIPPLELQNHFADFVQQTDKSKFI